MCSTHSPIIVESREVEKNEVGEEDEEGRKGGTTLSNFTLTGMSSQGQFQPAPSPPSLHLASFSEHERRRIEMGRSALEVNRQPMPIERHTFRK